MAEDLETLIVDGLTGPFGVQKTLLVARQWHGIGDKEGAGVSRSHAAQTAAGVDSETEKNVNRLTDGSGSQTPEGPTRSFSYFL